LLPATGDVATPPPVGYDGLVKQEHKTSALNRLKTVRGHLDAVIGMVEEERYCPEIMKQVSALQGSLEKVNRVLLANHVETCVLHAVSEGRTGQIVDELMETLRYTPVATGPTREEDV
jgi:DNA-binding FrmR family transcriptional regulator